MANLGNLRQFGMAGGGGGKIGRNRSWKARLINLTVYLLGGTCINTLECFYILEKNIS